MRRFVLIALLGASPAMAGAQDAGAGAVHVVVHVERPPEGSARRIAEWKPQRVTRAQIDKHGLTWEHEEKKLEAVYRDLRIL